MLSDNDQVEVVRVKTTTEIAAITKKCGLSRKRYTDESFLPTDSVWYAADEDHSEVEASGMRGPERWARLSEFLSRPILWPDEGPDPRGLMQGDVGTRYFLDATALLAAVCPEALRALFLKFDVSAGVYTVVFFVNAGWRVVLVDESVPVTFSQEIGTHCCYAECKKRRQIWLPLLEKAYAKVHRYYEHVHGGDPRNALVDLTGGAIVTVDMKNGFDNGYRWLHPYKGMVGELTVLMHLSFYNGVLGGGLVLGSGADQVVSSISGTYDAKNHLKFSTVSVQGTKELPGSSLQFIGIFNPDTKEMHGDCWSPDTPDNSQKWNVQLSKTGAAETGASLHAFDNMWSVHKAFSDTARQIITVHTEDKKAGPAMGLVPGRRYLVLGLWDLKNGDQVVKLRDLHGPAEWKGAYCEDSPSWTAEVLEVWIENYDEGVFFMPLAEFTKFFKTSEICTIPWRGWTSQTASGPWKDMKGPERWMENPKFKISLKDPGYTTLTITLSQPNTKLYEGYDHYIVGIGFYVLMEFVAPMKPQAGRQAGPSNALVGCSIIAHVPPQKRRDVSTVIRTYKMELAGITGGQGVLYVVPYVDTEGVDLPVFLNATADHRVQCEYLKNFGSVMLPMPTKSEAYSDELEKWYWEVRDQWEGVGAVIPRGLVGKNNKVVENMEKSIDAPKKEAPVEEPVEKPAAVRSMRPRGLSRDPSNPMEATAVESIIGHPSRTDLTPPLPSPKATPSSSSTLAAPGLPSPQASPETKRRVPPPEDHPPPSKPDLQLPKAIPERPKSGGGGRLPVLNHSPEHLPSASPDPVAPVCKRDLAPIQTGSKGKSLRRISVAGGEAAVVAKRAVEDAVSPRRGSFSGTDSAPALETPLPFAETPARVLLGGTGAKPSPRPVSAHAKKPSVSGTGGAAKMKPSDDVALVLQIAAGGTGKHKRGASAAELHESEVAEEADLSPTPSSSILPPLANKAECSGSGGWMTDDPNGRASPSTQRQPSAGRRRVGSDVGAVESRAATLSKATSSNLAHSANLDDGDDIADTKNKDCLIC